MVAFLDRLRQAPFLPELSDKEVVDRQYSHWRIRVFYSMYIGYALYYITRKSLVFTMPSLVKDLGYNTSDLGLLASIMALTYGVSKFVSGLLADQANPRYFMAFGLIATGICNIIFGLSSSLVLFAVLWGLNGWFQGAGWPPCARLLTHWYSHSERGRWWSWWSTAHNVGGAVVPLITAFCVQYFGWRAGMIFPGILVIFGGFFLINRLTDTPQSLGLPAIEKYRDDESPSKGKDSERALSMKEVLFEYVLNNKYIWVLGLSYFFVYFIRQAVNDWTVIYLMQTKGYSPLGAGAVIFWFEVGGLLGTLFAGWSSDRLFAANRGPVNALYCLFSILSIYLFWAMNGIYPFVDSFLMFTIGFFVFGPQMLIGVAAAELSHKKAAATATGFIGWIASLGCASAGYPLGRLLDLYGWEVLFVVLMGCAIISTVLLFPLWNVRSREVPVVA